MEFSLSEREQQVRRAFYRQYDDPQKGHWWYVDRVYEDNLVAWAEHLEKFFRVGYAFSPDAEPDERVAFAEETTWQEVTWQWVDVQRSMEDRKLEKRELMSDATGKAHTRLSAAGDVTSPETAYRDFRPEIRFSSDDNRTTFLIMTEAIARDGAVVRADGLDTSAYMQNPVVLWQHGRDAQRGMRPIGRTISLERKRSSDPSQNGWLATVEWNSDEFSQAIKRDVKEGFINMTSLGWLGRAELQRIEGRSVPVFEQSEMTEFSVVGVGSDRNALAQQRSTDDIRSIIREEIQAAIGRADVRAASTAVGTGTGPSHGQPGEQAQPAAAPSESAQEVTDTRAAEDVPDQPKQKIICLTLDDIQRLQAQRREAARAQALTQVKRQLGRA